MRQHEIMPKAYDLIKSPGKDDASIHLRSTETGSAIDFRLEICRPGLFRTTFTAKTHPLPPFPSASKPKTNAIDFECQSNDRIGTIICNDIEARVDWTSAPIVSIGFKHEEPLCTDLPFRSYVLDGEGVAHYTRFHRNSLHVGLGEKAAPMDLSNRHFTLSATDCFGYDVHRTDPMYKHIPLLIRATSKGVVATFYTTHSRGYYSIGSEMDGMLGFFKTYRQDYGGIEMYTMVARNLQEVVRLYAELTSFPLLVPRWAFGYLAGGMKYSMLDTPPAHDALMEFAEKLRRYDIPCSGFQLSSGYTIAETEPKTRNVFTWNRHRFPDPKAFCDAFHANGIRLIANIKPYILASHPEYKRLVESGALFIDPKTEKSAVARLWSAGGGESGEGGHIDFTSKAGYEFWYGGVKELRKTGLDCMWNDNNEYLLPSDDWQLALSHAVIKEAIDQTDLGRRDIGLWGRSMHCELMGKCSHDALAEAIPNERPFVLTRSATAGTMKYAASTWSGDNYTSWDSMRGANALSLTAGMCLMQCYGHDIGGFEGPQPSPELLLRWVQLGIHSPRFAINCFKTVDDNQVGDVIEPWMYPQILPEIRKAILRRYELIPYLYSLMLQSHLEAIPPQRWVGWSYESDTEVWSSRTLKDGEQQYWLGDTLMIGGVYEPGIDEAQIYLPQGSEEDAGFLNTNAPYQYLSSRQWARISSPWKSSIPVLARIGGLIPVGKSQQVVAPGDTTNEAKLPEDDWRGVEIFPPPKEHADGVRMFTNFWLEDDGMSPPPANIAKFEVTYSASEKEVMVGLRKEIESFAPPWTVNGLTFILPVGDSRRVISKERLRVVEEPEDEQGRKRFRVTYEPRATPSKL